jgi:hypothetical protein
MMKPATTTMSCVDWVDARKWVESLLGYDIRDTQNTRDHYDDWCRKHGEINDNSREQYNRYKPSEDGLRACPEYRDWWHFLCDHQEIHNGGSTYIGSGLLEQGEPWQNEITQKFIDEFGDDAEFWTNW